MIISAHRDRLLELAVRQASVGTRLSVLLDQPETIGKHVLEIGPSRFPGGASRGGHAFLPFGHSLGRQTSTMMTAEEYRARAAALIRSADGCRDMDLVIELEATAAEWRKLAALADAQTALLSALGATRD